MFDPRSRHVLAQILRNVVNLAMMDFPVEIARAQLLKSIDRAPMGDMLKVSGVFARALVPLKHYGSLL